MVATAPTQSELLSPAHPDLQRATFKALASRFNEDDLRAFLDKMGSPSTPAPLLATVDLKVALWGKLKVEPDDQPWKYDNTVYAAGAYGASGVAFMYTAYETWDAFWEYTTSFHVQGISAGGGILQVNWFNRDGIPVGQLNAAVGGIGGLEGGGSGMWEPR